VTLNAAKKCDFKIEPQETDILSNDQTIYWSSYPRFESNMMQLQDKAIIITGASSGIGATAATLFSKEGAKLVLGARREKELNAVAETVTQNGGSVIPQFLAGIVSRN